MGKYYYLSHGYNADDYKRCRLTKIFKVMKTLEQIVTFTSLFEDIQELKTYLYNNRYIDSYEEDIVIAFNKKDKKTGEIRLVPIFLKDLIFKRDLEMLGLNANDFKKSADTLWEYIKTKKNNKNFMRFMVDEYLAKYESKDGEKAPIYKSGTINYLDNCISSDDYALRNRENYSIWFANLFRNELYKCKKRVKKISNGRMVDEIDVFEPIDGSVNTKGFYDLLVRTIQYVKKYELSLRMSDSVSNNNMAESDHEDYLEERDYDFMLRNYAETDKLDLDNIDELMQDEFARNILEEKDEFIKKNNR